jgi:iron complex outermembrane receptor protein
MKKIKIRYLLMISLALFAGSTIANESADNEIIVLDALIVTGDLWTSELQKTTASVSLLDARTLSSPIIGHFDDVVASIPNLTTTGGTSRSRYIQIRAVGENSQFEGETPDSAVLYLIDNMDFTGLGTVGSLFDVRQIEVLRGPQAGAFGANAAGGMIRIVTQDPTEFWTTRASATLGNDSLMGGEVAVSGPIADNLLVRFAAKSQKSNGFYENEFLGSNDTNERDETAARLKLRWKGDRWQWDSAVFYADVDNGYDIFSLRDEPFKTFSNEPGRDEQESFGVSLRGQLDVEDGYSFLTKTAFMQTDSLYSYDADWTGASYAGFLATIRDRDVFNQEFRISSEDEGVLRWTLGFYYQDMEEISDVLYRDGDPSGGETAFGQVDVDSSYETETVAAFGQLSFDLSDQTRIIAGLRYELHDVAFDSTAQEQGYYVGALLSGERTNDDAVFGGKLTLEHDLSEDLMMFGSIARGYKAGGANSGSFTTPEYPATYDSETLWNVEAGLKGSWFSNRLNAQVTAFYLVRDGVQLRDSVGAGGFFRYLTINGDSATHLGLEAEFQWLINAEWRLIGGAGILDAERDSYTDPGGFVPQRELANAPSYSYQLALQYDAKSGAFASISISGRDSYFESNSHEQKRDSLTLLNATVGYQLGSWSISVWSKNLTDREYASRVFYFDNGEGLRRYEGLADPLQIGTTLTFEF